MLTTVAAPLAAQTPLTRGYVANLDGHSVSVVVLESGQTRATIPLGEPVHDVVVSLDESLVYASLPSSSRIAILDAVSLTVTGYIATAAGPREMHRPILGSGSSLLVDTQAGLQWLDPLGRRALDPVAPVPGVSRALASGAPPLVDHYATGCDGDDAMRVLDSLLRVTETIAVGRRPCGITAAGSYLFVSNRDDDSVSMINGITKVVVATIPVGDDPRGLLDGYSRVWVATASGVAGIDVDLRTVVTTIPVPGQPVALAFHLTSLVVVAAGSNQLHVVDPTTHAILRSIPTGARPNGIAFGTDRPIRRELISARPDGGAGNGPSLESAISADGRWVTFASLAHDLVSGDTNGVADVFVRDRLLERTVRVSVATSGTQADARSWRPWLSDNGRFVLFTSTAATLVEGDTNGLEDLFLHDRDSDGDGVYDEPGQRRTIRISVQTDGSQATCRVPPAAPDSCSTEHYRARLSGDGRQVAFTTLRELVPDDVNGVSDVYVRDVAAGRTTRLSLRQGGLEQATAAATTAVLNRSGRYVAFNALDALVPDDTNGLSDAYLCDRDGDGDGVFDEGPCGLRRISLRTDGTQYTGQFGGQTVVAMSHDARWVSFGALMGSTYGIFDRLTTSIASFTEGYFAGYIEGQFSENGRYIAFKGYDNYSFAPRVFRYDRDPDADGVLDEVDAYQLGEYLAIMPEPLSFDATLRYWMQQDFGSVALMLIDPLAPAADIFDSDADGLSNEFEAQFNLSPSNGTGANGAEGDPDADGRTNAQEQVEGTHPRGLFTRYLAEGATGSFFSTRIAVANPQETAASVLLRYQTDTRQTTSTVLFIPAGQRRFVNVGTVPSLGSANFSTVIESDVEVLADRSMFWTGDYQGSHAETSLAAPSTTWYLAEGATHGAFDLFYLIQNPHPSAAADIEVRFLLSSGPPVVRTYTVGAASRLNVYVDQIPGLGAVDVSGVVTSVNAIPVIVERAMYYTRPDAAFAAGHESAGVTAPATQWLLAEGATGSFFDLFVLIANPAASPAELRITYLLPNGSTVVKSRTVAASSRTTIYVESEDPALADTPVSTIVESTNGVGVIVERAMWWPALSLGVGWYEAHNSPGATSAAARWGFADGEVGNPPFNAQTYFLIANPTATDASVRVRLLFDDGTAPVARTFTVRGNSRFNVAVGGDFPEARGKGFGAVIESLGASPVPIVVERAMYSDANGLTWAAGTNALGTRLP